MLLLLVRVRFTQLLLFIMMAWSIPNKVTMDYNDSITFFDTHCIRMI